MRLALLLFSCLALACNSDDASLGGTDRAKVFACETEACDDCAFLESKLKGRSTFDRARCDRCQGTACDADAGASDPCSSIPCVGGKRLIKGCNVDTDCKGISTFCGQYASEHNTCVLNDPK